SEPGAIEGRPTPEYMGANWTSRRASTSLTKRWISSFRIRSGCAPRFSISEDKDLVIASNQRIRPLQLTRTPHVLLNGQRLAHSPNALQVSAKAVRSLKVRPEAAGSMR